MEILGGFVGKNTTPYAKVTSGITSIALLGLIYFNLFSQWNIAFYGFLAFHLIGQISSALIDSRKFVCSKCGQVLVVSSHNFAKHKCMAMKKR